MDIAKFLPEAKNFYLNATGFDSNPFNFQFLDQFSAQLNLTADELFYQNSQFDNTTLRLNLANKKLTLEDFISTGEQPELHTLQARGSLDWNQTPTLDLRLVTQRVPLTPHLFMFDETGLEGGFLSSNWNLNTSGETPLEMARTLSGSGSVRLEDTDWVGIDLLAAHSMIQQAQERGESKEDLEQKLDQTLTNGASRIYEISGNFAINDGLWQLSAGHLDSEFATANALNLAWDIPTNNIKAKIPLILRQYPTLPSIIYNFTQDKRGVTYDADLKPFLNALAQEFSHQKSMADALAVQNKKEEVEQQLLALKQQTETSWNQLNEQITQVQQELNKNPDTLAQKELKAAQGIQQMLSTTRQQKDLTLFQYQAMNEQLNLALQHLSVAQSALFKQQLKEIEEQANSLLQPASDLIVAMNELYQKRPTLSLLPELIQNSENERNIMKRAQEQFKKQLSPQQVQKVAQIMQTSYNKIKRAHQYAEELYSGRRITSSSQSF